MAYGRYVSSKTSRPLYWSQVLSVLLTYVLEIMQAWEDSIDILQQGRSTVLDSGKGNADKENCVS